MSVRISNIKRARIDKYSKRHNHCAHLTERKDIKLDKMAQQQQQQSHPQVHWGDKRIPKCHRFEYLGSLLQVDADQMPEIKRRVAIYSNMFSIRKLRHVWAAGEQAS